MIYAISSNIRLLFNSLPGFNENDQNQIFEFLNCYFIKGKYLIFLSYKDASKENNKKCMSVRIGTYKNSLDI
jgi:hypothetical protein